MSYYILPKNNNNININPTFSDSSYNNLFISHSLYNYYNDSNKQIIDICINNHDLSFNTYEEIIKIINPYEYIFSKVPGSKFSVSKLKPKTNLFYEFLEVCTTLNVFEGFKNRKINSLHITKNHVDSIECFEMLRENFADNIMFSDYINDGFIKSLNENKFDFLFFETKTENINAYLNSFFEFLTIILRHQNSEGLCIIKINHILYKPFVDILYLLSSFYEKIYIIKPNTSNVTSFDKYIVCKFFLLDENRINYYKLHYIKLMLLLKNIANKNITSLVDNIIPYYFTLRLDDMNIIIGQQQLEAFDQIINILKNKNKEEKIEIIKKINIQKAVNWCEKYKIPYNKFTEKINIFLPIIKEAKEFQEITELQDIQVLE
jgi:hypothetical protein